MVSGSNPFRRITSIECKQSEGSSLMAASRSASACAAFAANAATARAATSLTHERVVLAARMSHIVTSCGSNLAIVRDAHRLAAAERRKRVDETLRHARENVKEN
jgi:hypothetical protein